ncbi:hypothetical protein C464_05505 [Halorubrum coriense DSM 10284]|uniref:Uncharacterized protein n=1 Tax=Halorubrum coriense DSM 10284 TaxID=1227466 RepID=M0EM26_9EURY|nr:hypothetical protein [Halorubrum coriense]ELZ48841.1 hypothetical protein C464_05505 [Halorubrum coriense DSM 10284]
MTTIQQVVFELSTPYAGRPYHVSGHALFQAIAGDVDDRTRRDLQVSHGIFAPSEYGSYPESHSQKGYAGKLGGSLPPVESYEDLFLFRDAAQRWLQPSRPRDAQNTMDRQSHGGRLTVAPESFFGVPEHQRNSKRRVKWYVHAYLHSEREGILPLDATVLDGIQLGGARNYGFGEVSLVDSQVVELDALSFDGLRGHDAYTIELVTPYVLQSEAPDADAQSVPWWWDTSVTGMGSDAPTRDRRLRRREERLAGEITYELATVDHGQMVGYGGSDPVETAKNGVLRLGTHARFGFGELRVRPAEHDRVPAREGVA